MNLKELIEKQNDLKATMQSIVNKAQAEKRGLTDDENKQFTDCENQIKGIQDTIDKADALAKMGLNPVPENKPVDEVKKFENAIRGIVTNAADDITKADGQVTIPTTIASEILQKVKDICPIYSLSQHYEMTGKLVLVKEGDSSTLAMSYCTEGASGDTTGVVFEENIVLDEFLARVLTKVSNSLINNSQFDIVAYVENRIAEAVSEFIEHELLVGTSSKVAGLSGVTTAVTAAKATTVTADELIDVQESIPDVYQSNAVWIMNKATRTAIRKLKDGDGNFLLNKDFTSAWGYTLLGKPVYCSDNMPKMAAKANAIYYGDMSGLAVKTSETMEMTVLREVYAAEHMTGLVAFLGMDAKVQNPQKIAKLTMASA